MNKIWLFGAAVCMVLALGSCKPKQSAYKAAYEQAKEKESTAPVEVVEQEEEVVEVAPVSKPRTYGYHSYGKNQRRSRRGR